LTNCDAYEAFFLPFLRPIQYAARLFGMRFVDLVAWALRARLVQQVLFKTVAIRHIDDVTLDAYMAPLIQEQGVRGDLARLLREVSGRYTLEAARSFPGFDRPVLIAWGPKDHFFSSRLALRFQHDFPHARLEVVPGSRVLVPEDQPEQLARLVEGFCDENVGGPRDAHDGTRERVFSGD
jgi:pimeloyl-ACP methyl ester carboxylesterase